MRLTELCSVNLPLGVFGGGGKPKIFKNFCLKLNSLSNALGLRHVINSIVVEL